MAAGKKSGFFFIVRAVLFSQFQLLAFSLAWQADERAAGPAIKSAPSSPSLCIMVSPEIEETRFCVWKAIGICRQSNCMGRGHQVWGRVWPQAVTLGCHPNACPALGRPPSETASLEAAAGTDVPLPFNSQYFQCFCKCWSQAAFSVKLLFRVFSES